MLESPRPEYLNAAFQESVKELARVTRKAKLIRKIDQKSQEAENASPEELVQILADLKEYREQIRKLER